MTFIIVQFQFEGVHNWPAAPKQVDFLQHPHRHMFHVRAEIEVLHADRELEIIMVKRELETFAKQFVEAGAKSCEMMAEAIQDYIKTHFPLPDGMIKNQDRLRYAMVEVLEDGENGARVDDPVYHLPSKFATGGFITTDSVKPLTVDAGQIHLSTGIVSGNIAKIVDSVKTLGTKTARHPVTTEPEQLSFDNIHKLEVEPSYIQQLIDDVEDLDEQFGITGDTDMTTSNLMFMSNALAGEVGELCNYVKKIVRDGATDQLWEDIDFEIVDVLIYLVKLMKITNTDLNSAWDKKHEQLRERYAAGKKHQDYRTRHLVRGE